MENVQRVKLTGPRRTILGFTMIAAPLSLLIGWIILMQRAGNGPDAGWFISHAFLLLGVILFIPVIIGLRIQLPDAPNFWADSGALLALVGVATLVGQFAIDLVVGFISSDQDAMSLLFRQISDAPGIVVVFNLIGPVVFYGGLMALLILMMQQHVISRWSGMLAVASIVAIGAQAVTGNALLA